MAPITGTVAALERPFSISFLTSSPEDNQADDKAESEERCPPTMRPPRPVVENACLLYTSPSPRDRS